MKKIMAFCMIALMCCACEYSEKDRQNFYESCMIEHENKTFLDQVFASCVCKNWAMREDIVPKKGEERKLQIREEFYKCQHHPVKLDYAQRKLFLNGCKETFTKKYESRAEVYLRQGMPVGTIAELAMYFPDMYETRTNAELVDCACERFSLQDNFMIPADLKTLGKELEKEAKECQRIWDKR